MITSFILLAFALWMYVFKGYVMGELSLISDGAAYYDHFKFFVDYFSRGIYPLWDATYYHGLPIEFFLRRIGSFNPFILLIMLFNKIGLAHFQSYILFLNIYYLTGMAGFCLLANRLLGHKMTAFVAVVLLSFSSFSTTVFDSYLIFTYVPMIWFFYFLIAFSQQPQRHFFLGMTFTAMLLFTTYILSTFFVFYLAFYPRAFKRISFQYWAFFKNNKIFVILCLLALAVSLIPGVLFFKEAGSGEIMMPSRSGVYTMSTENVMKVDRIHILRWAILEELIFSSYFLDNLRKLEPAVFYIPFFGIIIFCVGAWAVGLNKKLGLFLSWGTLLFLIGLPTTTPIFKFFDQYVFFFKYIRNLHFILWMIILPILVLFLAEQLRVFLSYSPRSRKEKAGLFIFLVLIHAGLAFFVSSFTTPIPSTYVTIVLSLLFFTLYFAGWLRPAFMLALLFLVITIEPFQAYGYFVQNVPHKRGDYLNRTKYNKFVFGLPRGPVDPLPPVFYFSMSWYAFLLQNFDLAVLGDYLSNKVILYDKVERLDPKNVDIDKIEKNFKEQQNIAFVPDSYPADQLAGSEGALPEKSQLIGNDSKEVGLISFGVNHVKFKADLPSRKFFVYNDNFHSNWEAFVDGKKVDLWRTNLSFKGLWVPAGEHVVYFRYGKDWQYALNFSLLAIFYFIFARLIWLSFKSRRHANEKN